MCVHFNCNDFSLFHSITCGIQSYAFQNEHNDFISMLYCIQVTGIISAFIKNKWRACQIIGTLQICPASNLNKIPKQMEH